LALLYLMSSYYYICVRILLCVLILLYMCPHTTKYVSSHIYTILYEYLALLYLILYEYLALLYLMSSYYYICVRILLCVLILLYMCPHTTMCPHTYYYTICILGTPLSYVLILLYMCPHTSICVLILLYMCPHTDGGVSQPAERARHTEALGRGGCAQSSAPGTVAHRAATN
jgi:hypothetical protein